MQKLFAYLEKFVYISSFNKLDLHGNLHDWNEGNQDEARAGGLKVTHHKNGNQQKSNSIWMPRKHHTHTPRHTHPCMVECECVCIVNGDAVHVTGDLHVTLQSAAIHSHRTGVCWHLSHLQLYVYRITRNMYLKATSCTKHAHIETDTYR